MKIKELNCETGKEILRDATPEEISQAQQDSKQAQIEADAKAEVQTKRQVLLHKLGITEEEAQLLLNGTL